MITLIKMAFTFVTLSLLILYMMIVIIPYLISTITIPISALLIIAATTIACGIITIYYNVKHRIDNDDKEEDYQDYIC